MTAVSETDPALARAVITRAPNWVRNVYRANLVAQIGIVITGGIVRVTGSGLGCPTWPECVEGSITPTSTQTEAWQKYVEFGNRTLTGLLVVLALAALLATTVWRRRSGVRRRRLLMLAWIPMLGTFAQALLGGVTVLMDLNPLTVAAHFLLSMAIIAGCVVLVQVADDDRDPPGSVTVRPVTVALSNLLIAVTAVVLVIGTIVTGSGPHAGDADVGRLNLDPRLISWLHADVVLLFIGLLVGMVVLLYVDTGSATAVRRAWFTVAAAVFQAAIGYIQYFTGLPWTAVVLHLLGACLVWVCVWRLRLALTDRSSEVLDTA